MPRNKNETKSEGNIGMYVAAGVFGAAAAAIGYYLGKNSESSESHTQYSHRDTPRATPVANYVDTDCDCAICLDAYQPIKILSCNHKLHADCINKWFAECERNTPEGEEVHYTCPKCNQRIQS